MAQYKLNSHNTHNNYMGGDAPDLEVLTWAVLYATNFLILEYKKGTLFNFSLHSDICGWDPKSF